MPGDNIIITTTYDGSERVYTLKEWLGREKNTEISQSIIEDILKLSKCTPKYVGPTINEFQKVRNGRVKILTQEQIEEVYMKETATYKILQMILTEGPVSASDISKRFEIDVSNVTSQTSRLSKHLPEFIDVIQTRPFKYSSTILYQSSKSSVDDAYVLFKKNFNEARRSENEAKYGLSKTKTVSPVTHDGSRIGIYMEKLENFVVESWLDGVNPDVLESMAKDIIRRRMK